METMEIDDRDDDSMNKTLMTEGIAQRKRPNRAVSVCLGLLCAALLAANVAQALFYEIIHRPLTQANSSVLTQSNNNLTSTKSDSTKGNQQLLDSFRALKTEMGELEDSYRSVTQDRDLFRANYSSLKQDRDQLKENYEEAQRSLEALWTNHSLLMSSFNQIQTNYSSLETEKDQLQTLFNELKKNLDQLESNYSSLIKDRDQLEMSLDRLNMSKSHTENSYTSLWKDKNQLEKMYDTLWKENELFQSNYSTLESDRDRIKTNVNKLTAKVRGMSCPTLWRKFETSCYFISTGKKNWTQSRESCISAGADLLVIESHGEQEFVNKQLELNQNVWIGLTDSLEEGVWTWVDGSPVTTEWFWEPGQPNSYSGDQDCVEFLQNPQEGAWNDDGCFAEQTWICEI